MADENRQDPRPMYYSSASGSSVTISYEFETYIINLTDSQKSSVIARLRKAVDTSNKRTIRDDLASQALKIDGSNCGAAKQELSVTLGEFESYENDTLASNGDINEVSMMIDDMASGYALPMFLSEEAQYGIVYASLLKTEITSGDSNSDFKKEITSWIDVIQQYMS